MSKIFISYSHSDKRWLDRLLVHLRPMEREGVIDLWADTRIGAGDDWRHEIEAALAAADIAFLLISADFLASDFIASIELPALLLAARQRNCKVLSIIVGPCIFSRIHDLAQFQAINTPARPLKKMRPAEAEETLVRAAGAALDHLSAAGEATSHTRDAAGERRSEFVGDARVDQLIRKVKLGDWLSAERAAVGIIGNTGPDGGNATFRSLLTYQDCGDADERFFGAMHVIESCAHLATWLITREDLSRMAHHENFSVRSSAASICMGWAHSCPHLVPLDLAMKLSVYNENWYVEAPANAAIKAMARSFPAALHIFFMRLNSSSPEESAHAANELLDVARKEPGLLDRDVLVSYLPLLTQNGHDEAAQAVAGALRRLRGRRRTARYRYGL